MRHDEQGRILVLGLGFFVVAGLLMAVVVNVSAVFLEHRRLSGLADQAALRAADMVHSAAVYEQGLAGDVSVDEARARQRAREVVSERATLEMTVTNDEVVVQLSTNYRLPISPPGWPSHSRIEATASARSVLVEP